MVEVVEVDGEGGKLCNGDGELPSSHQARLTHIVAELLFFQFFEARGNLAIY